MQYLSMNTNADRNDEEIAWENFTYTIQIMYVCMYPVILIYKVNVYENQ